MSENIRLHHGLRGQFGEERIRVSLLATLLLLLIMPTISAESVTLAWDPPHRGFLAGYNVYRSDDPEGPWVKLNSQVVTETLFIDTTVPPEVEQFYAVTTVDADGRESDFSSQISVIVKKQPLLISAGPDREVKAGQTVVLSASTSVSGSFSFAWSQIGGTQISLSDTESSSLAFLAPEVDTEERLTFEVRAIENDETEASVQLVVTVVPR
jgi:hypothetical protein